MSALAGTERTGFRPWRCPPIGAKQTSSLNANASESDPFRALFKGTDVDYPALPTRLSISLRSATKSMGLVSSPSAPPSRAFRFVTSSP